MSVFETSVSNLVLVAKEYDQSTDSETMATASVAGTISMYNPDGSGFDATGANSAGKGVKLRLGRSRKEPGATLTQDLISQTIKKEYATVVQKPFKYPKRHIGKIDVGATTFVAGDEISANIRFVNRGVLSNNEFYDLWASHVVQTGATAQATVLAALVADLNRNLAALKRPAARTYLGAALTDFTSKINSASHFAVTTGSTTVTQYDALTAGATVNTTAGALTITVLISGVPYQMTTAGSAATWTLDRPYEGADSARLAAAAFTASGADTIYVIADNIDENELHLYTHPFNPIQFDAPQLRINGEGGPLVTTGIVQQCDRGNGYAPFVKLREELSIMQFIADGFGRPEHMRNRNSLVDLTKQYDTIIITMRVPNGGDKGSQVYTSGTTEIYIPRNAGANKTAADMVTDILANY